MASGSSLDVGALLHALDNDTNSAVAETTTAEIQRQKNDMLQRLQLRGEELRKLHRTLKHYRYVEELAEVLPGRYIRWIPLRDPTNIRLTNGGIVCDIQCTLDVVKITCRNRTNRMFSLRLDECLVFQRLTDQERVILAAMDHLAT